jgi:peroxidase
MNPANSYPWPVASHNGRPTVVSAEMAVVYRFHEFIINSFPIKDASNQTIWDQKLFDTGFNASGYLDAGLENILRGIVSTSIPNFKSGVDEAFRSAGKYRGKPFDIVVWSIVHEREQGLPAFNDYFRAYNSKSEFRFIFHPPQDAVLIQHTDPSVKVPIRNKFEDFTTDKEMLTHLKRLYKTPDEVDLVVGCQLDETFFPHASIPTSALIISLFNLINLGNSDRFGIGFAAMRCLLVEAPWNCHPSNALEDLIWKPAPRDGFPDFRWYDEFWMQELDMPAHGQNLLWRIVTENTEIKCLQKNPLFPVDPDTNPVLCALPPQKLDIHGLVATGLQVSLSWLRAHRVELVATGLVSTLGWLAFKLF